MLDFPSLYLQFNSVYIKGEIFPCEKWNPFGPMLPVVFGNWVI
jgi:hypothetical protein